MKSTEIVQEGPIDFVGKVGAGIKGALTKGSNFTTGYQQKAADQELTAYAKQSYPAWNKAIVSFQQRGVTPPQMGPELQKWATRYFGVQAPAFPGVVNAKSSMDYLKMLWGMKLNPQDDSQPATPSAPAKDTAPAADQGTKDAAPADTAPASAAPAAPAPAADPAHAVFKDPNAFKAEWDKFVASKPNYKLIADPQLLSVLKNMWMRSGGMKAESKKNKGKRV